MNKIIKDITEKNVCSEFDSRTARVLHIVFEKSVLGTTIGAHFIVPGARNNKSRVGANDPRGKTNIEIKATLPQQLFPSRSFLKILLCRVTHILILNCYQFSIVFLSLSLYKAILCPPKILNSINFL